MHGEDGGDNTPDDDEVGSGAAEVPVAAPHVQPATLSHRAASIS